MTRRNKHPSADQLACLAAGGLRPRRAARIEAHLARCGPCTQLGHELNAITDILGSASYPPMPHHLSARLDAAISQEARQRQAAQGPVAQRLTAHHQTAQRPAVRRLAGQHLAARRPSTGPGLPLMATRLAAAVGAIVIVAAGGYRVAQNAGNGVTHAPSSPLAAAAAPAHHMSLGPNVTYGQPASLDTIRAVQSQTNFVAARLRAQAISALNAAEGLDNFAAQPPASKVAPLAANAAADPEGDPAGSDPAGSDPAGVAYPASTAYPAGSGLSASRLAGCIGLIAPGRTVLLIDIARYQGKPAAMIVTAPTVVIGAEAWVVGSSCSATTKDVLVEAALGNP